MGRGQKLPPLGLKRSNRPSPRGPRSLTLYRAHYSRFDLSVCLLSQSKEVNGILGVFQIFELKNLWVFAYFSSVLHNENGFILEYIQFTQNFHYTNEIGNKCAYV